MVLRVFALLLASNEVFIHCLDVLEAVVFWSDYALAAGRIPELFKSRSPPGYCILITKLELSPLLLVNP